MHDDYFSRFIYEKNKVPKEHQDERYFYCLHNVLSNPERKLHFMVESNLSFEIEAVQFSDGITLKPWPQPLKTLSGRSINDKEVQETLEQLTTGRYLIIGEYANFDDSRDLGPQVLETISKIDNILAVLGLVTRAKMHWYPTYGRISSEVKPRPAGVGQVALKEEQVDQAKIIWSILNSLPQDDKDTLIAAVDWHWQGQNSPSVLNSFESYWKAIEALSAAWARKLGGKRDDETISRLLCDEAMKTKYKKYLNYDTNEAHLPLNVIPQFVRWAGDLVRTTAQSNISTAFQHCFDEQEATNLVSNLFDGSPSMKELRDGIAHGIITEADHDKKTLIYHKIPQLQSISDKFIVSSINKGLR